MADGDTKLKAACLRGDVSAAAQLLPAAPEGDCDEAFVVAVARGQEDLLAALPALARGGGAAVVCAIAHLRGEDLDERPALIRREHRPSRGLATPDSSSPRPAPSVVTTPSGRFPR